MIRRRRRPHRASPRASTRRGGSGRRGTSRAALAVLAGMDGTKAEPHQARWAYAEWTDLVRRRSGGGNVLVYRATAGPLPWFPPATTDRWRWRRSSGCAGGPARSSHGAATVDIAALKARHPLGDVVEASGVRLRGRGRVRQGVCPFHDEAEGSFTVYADTERFYCFGCGAGGDVLDFIRRVENLSLPEAIARLDGSPGRKPWAANRPAGPRRGVSTPVSSGAAPPPGSTWPRGASARPRQPASASAMRRAAGCGRLLSRTASLPTGSRTAACSWSGEPSGSPGWSSFPTPPAVSSAGSSGGP